MLRRDVFLAGLTAALALVVLNAFAFHYFWYWRLFWFDSVMHFLAGLAIGLIGASFLVESEKPGPACFSRRWFWQPVLTVLIIGLAWELVEFRLGELWFWPLALRWPRNPVVLNDSVTDLVFDIIGAVFAVAVAPPLGESGRQPDES